MPTLRFLLPCLASVAPVIGLLWSLIVQAAPTGWARPGLLRKEDMTDWLLHDIGWKDGRDLSARREARMTAHRWL